MERAQRGHNEPQTAEIIDRPRSRLKLSVKMKIREAFGWACQYCDYVCPKDNRLPHLSEAACEVHDYANRQTLHIDRIMPRAKGGDYSFRNITLSCRQCNLSKAAGDPAKPVKSYADILEGSK